MNPQIGQNIGGYLLLRTISTNAVASTYECVSQQTGRPFIIKIAKQAWKNCETLAALSIEPGFARAWEISPNEILRREFVALNDLKEMELCLPIVRESGRWEGLNFTLFEHFGGETLASRMSSGRLVSLRVLADVCLAVHDLRMAGLFHGNLHPGSILVNEKNVLLCDIGLPFVEFDENNEDAISRLVTNPEYYPFLDPRHDIFAIGILLYFFFCRVHPMKPKALHTFKNPVRISRRVLGLLNQARLRGANRYATTISDLLNPTQTTADIGVEIEDLILRTLGIWRSEDPSGNAMIDMVPESWLDNELGLTSNWTLADTADALDFLSVN